MDTVIRILHCSSVAIINVRFIYLISFEKSQIEIEWLQNAGANQQSLQDSEKPLNLVYNQA